MPRVTADVQHISDQHHRHAHPLGLGGIADEVDLIRQRAQILSRDDRALVMLYLDRGRSYAEVAQLAGVCEATIARRVGRIIRRLMDGQYITCLRNRQRLGPLGEAIAKDHLIDGLAIDAIALRRDVTVYRVRKTLNAIRGLLNENAVAARRTRRSPSERRD